MTKREIKTELQLSGEKEYKAALKSVNSELGVLKSEMKVVDSEFQNNEDSIEALEAKNKVLGKQYETQAQKLSILQKALESARNTQDGYSKRLEEARAKVDAAKKSMDEYAKSSDATEEGQKELKEKLEAARKELEAAEKAYSRNNESISGYEKQVNYAQATLNQFKNEIGKNNDKLDEMHNAADSAAESVNDVGKKMGDAAGKSEDFGKKSSEAIDALGSAMVAAGVKEGLEEITEGLYDCVNASKGFKADMAETWTLLPELSSKAKEELTADMIGLKNDYGIASKDLTSALYQSVSAGVAAGKSTEFLTTAQKAAVGGVTDLTTAVDGITSVTNAYGTENLEAGKAADLMFTAVKYGKTTFGELASSLYNVVPIAASTGIAFEDVTAAMASMTIQGVPTAQSTTQMRQMLVELSTSGTKVSKVFEQAAGVSFKTFIRQGKNVSQALNILDGRAKESGLSINEMFSSVEAGNAALALAGKNAERYEENIRNMEQSAGATDQAFQTMAETTEFSAKKFEAATDSLKIAIGDQLEPALKNMYESGTNAFVWAAKFVEENPWVVKSVVALGSATGVLTVAVAGYTVATNVAIPAIKAFNTAIAANPVGAAVVAISALSAGIAALVVTVDDSGESQDNYRNRMVSAKDATDELEESIKNLKNTVAENSDNTAMAETYIKQLKDLETQGLKSKAVQTLYNETLDKLKEIYPELTVEIDETTGAVKGGTDALLKNVKAFEKQSNATEALRVLEDAKAAYQQTQEDIDANTESMEKYQEQLEELAEKQEDAKPNSAEWIELDQAIDYINAFTMPAFVEQDEVLREELENQKEAIDEARDTYDEYNQVMTESKEKTDEITAAQAGLENKLSNIQISMDELQQEYESAYNAAYNSVTNTFGLFETMDEVVGVSVDDMISSLQSQIDYMDEYAANLQRASELGVDQGLIAKLSDGSVESAAILKGIVEDGGTNIDDLNEKFAKVEKGKTTFADKVAKMATDFDERMGDITKSLDDMVKEIDQYDAAYTAADNTVSGAVDAVEDRLGEMRALGKRMGYAQMQGYKEATEQASPSKAFRRLTANNTAGITLQTKEDLPKIKKAYVEVGETAKKAYFGQMQHVLDMYSRMTSYMAAPATQKISNTRSTVNNTRSVKVYNHYGGSVNKMSYADLERTKRKERQKILDELKRS